MVLKSQKPFNATVKGFTLIELMIVIAIVGILSSIAYASYNNYVTRSSRGDAMEKLTEIMSQQQRYILRQRTYTTDLTNLGYSSATVITDNRYYNIAATACPLPGAAPGAAAAGGGGLPINRCVLLTAAPINPGRQANDGNLTLDSNRQKSHAGRVGWYQQN